MRRINIKGFTLLELMISIVLLSIFMAYLYGLYFTEIKEYRNINNLVHTQFDTKKTLDIISKEIKEAIIVNVNSDLSTVHNLEFEPNGTDEKNKILATDEKGNTTIIIDLNGNTNAKIYLQGDNLKYKDGTLLCSNVKSVLIKKIDEDGKNYESVHLTLVLKTGNKYNDEYSVKTAINICR